MDVASFKKLPILGILRGIEPDILEPLMEIVEWSGLKTMEFTMNTAGAPDLIRKAAALSKGRVAIGAGTVLDMEGLKSALDAGASFIVMPVLVKDVLEHCVSKRIPVFPGALTPQEIYTAWSAGATMVKVFPSNFFGPPYFKEIRGPFNDIELLACGGVTPENMGAYFSSGASAISFGASVFRKERLAAKDFQSIGTDIRNFIQVYKTMKG